MSFADGSVNSCRKPWDDPYAGLEDFEALPGGPKSQRGRTMAAKESGDHVWEWVAAFGCLLWLCIPVVGMITSFVDSVVAHDLVTTLKAVGEGLLSLAVVIGWAFLSWLPFIDKLDRQ